MINSTLLDWMFIVSATVFVCTLILIIPMFFKELRKGPEKSLIARIEEEDFNEK